MTESSVTILTNERDFAADVVVRRLNDLGVEVHRINFERAQTGAVASWSPSLYVGADRARPNSVWWRQFETDESPPTFQEMDDLLVKRAQWRTWIATLASPGSTWMNDLWAARRAENKVEQLRVATLVGFNVPRTLITNERSQAIEFERVTGPAVIKTLTSAYFSFSDKSFVFTEHLRRATALPPDAWHGAPIVVQELIDNGLDARVISLAGHCFAAQCRSRGLDWRKTPFDPELWESWDPPEEIVDACETYRAQLGLEFAAFDFMITPESIYFLEANQAGEWLFLDRTLDLGIGHAIANRLASLGINP